MATVTPIQFARKMNNLKRCFDSNKKQIVLPAMKLAEGLLKKRIFNEGKASDGARIGSYSQLSGWRKIRESKGRQVAYKDLFFNGDLQRNITVGTNKGDFVLGFASDKFRKIMEGQEQQTSKDIINLTKEEVDKVSKLLGKEFSQCLEQSFKK